MGRTESRSQENIVESCKAIWLLISLVERGKTYPSNQISAAVQQIVQYIQIWLVFYHQDNVKLALFPCGALYGAIGLVVCHKWFIDRHMLEQHTQTLCALSSKTKGVIFEKQRGCYHSVRELRNIAWACNVASVASLYTAVDSCY